MKTGLPRFCTLFAISISLLLVSVFAFGCSHSGQTPTVPSQTAATTKPITSTAQVETGSKYSILMFIKDLQVGSVSLDQLLKLKQVTITSEGKTENGPTLPSVLNLAGIKDYTSVTVYGFSKGRLATAQLTLQKSEINDTMVVDISNQGTAKLSGTAIPSGNWIIDITKIVAQ
jgi:hypothetical protein